MSGNVSTAWWSAGLEAWSLGAEAAQVVGLRMVRLAAGGAPAMAEARTMVEEKIGAATALQVAALSGRLGTTPLAVTRGTLAHYRRTVAANRRRLSR